MAIDSGLTLRFRASEQESWLYDCHSQHFASVEHGADMATGFVPLFLSQLFGIPIARWAERMREIESELARRGPEGQKEVLSELRPQKSPSAAAEMALLVYPSAERYVLRTEGEFAPFQLRPEYLAQPNVPLAYLEARLENGWQPIVEPDELSTRLGRSKTRERLLAPTLGKSAVKAVAPGVYLTGHSGLLVHTGRTGLLFDPIPRSKLARPSGFTVADLAALSDWLILTHGHFDHYHLPSLLSLSARPLLLPSVKYATVVCEDMCERLRSFGVEPCAPAWGDVIEIGDARLHILPFVGEQFLTSQCHPEVRNWGNCYVVEMDGARVFVAADAGFEPGRSIIDTASAWVRENGPIDIVACQAIGLHTAFGQGDPDLQITALACAHRAREAFEFLCPERRVTLSADDIPRLCAVTGARTVILYGQFEFEPGQSAVRLVLLERVREALRQADCPAETPPLHIGEGVATKTGVVVRLPSL